MASGRIVPPNLDDRTWQDIVDEARSLIPGYTPEWTDHNASDLGITMIELFAWIVEGMIYRLNRVPEKNFVEFLNLIGQTRDPATPASAQLTFTVSGPGPVAIPARTRVATVQTETEESVIFETDEDLTALPVNVTHCLLLEKTGFPFPYTDATQSMLNGPLQDTQLELVAWVGAGFLLGFDQPTTNQIEISLLVRKGAKPGHVALNAFYLSPSWTSANVIEDRTEGLVRDGKFIVQVPPGWQAATPQAISFINPATTADEVSDSRYWLWVTMANTSGGSEVKLRLEGVAVNSVRATNVLTINNAKVDSRAELLGTGTGKPFQVLTLKNAPLFKTPNVDTPYEHLAVQVRDPLPGGGFGPWADWQLVDDIHKGDVPEFRCNPVTSEIVFGNYDPAVLKGNGRIPPDGSEIRALDYRHVAGGADGNVPAHSLEVLRSAVPGVVSVTNPGAASGGSDQEKIEDAKRRGPLALRNRYRAVTIEDYEYLAKEASTDVAIVRALPPCLYEKDYPPKIHMGDPWTYANIVRSPGRVNVIIVPQRPFSVACPEPEEELVLEVADYLNDRRTATSLLYVTGPKYLPIDVEVDLFVWQRAIDEGLVENVAQAENEVKAGINRFLHPLHGNIDGDGWSVGQHVFIADLFEFIMPDPTVGFIERLELKAAIPLYFDPLQPWDPNARPYPINVLGVWVQLADYELLCSGTHVVAGNIA